jgi:hypothetical protein
MTHVPVKLHLRYQIWSSSAAGDNPAGYQTFDNLAKAMEFMERKQKEVDTTNFVSKSGKKL